MDDDKDLQSVDDLLEGQKQHAGNPQDPLDPTSVAPQAQDEEEEKDKTVEEVAQVEEQPAAESILATDNQTAVEQAPKPETDKE